MKTYKDYIAESNMSMTSYMVKLNKNNDATDMKATPESLSNILNFRWLDTYMKDKAKKIGYENYEEIFKNIIFADCTDNKNDILKALNKYSFDSWKASGHKDISLLLASNWKFVNENKNFELAQYNIFTNRKTLYSIYKAFTFKSDNGDYIHIYFIKNIKNG